MRRRADRAPSEAELALWHEVARSVRPLPGRQLPPPAPDIAEAPKQEARGKASAALQPVSKAAVQPPLAPIDQRLRTALRRGTRGIDGVIDLHGMRQDEAHAALIAFLHRARGRGASLVLVVTGKGGGGVTSDGAERGVLRRVVPHWLRLPELRPLIVGFDEAGQAHGGSGALYVRLRRARP